MREQVEAEVLKIERARAQQNADPRDQLLRFRRRAQLRQIALRGDERVERVELDADRRGEARTLGALARAGEQQRARGLQLLGKRGLLADARAVDFGEVAPSGR